MTLCLGLVEDVLGRPILYKNYIKTDNPFDLERCEIYCGGSVFNAGVLYLAVAESLPDKISVQDSAALICIGMPPDDYTAPPHRLLVIDDSLKLAELANEVNRIFFEYNTLEQKLQDAVNKGRSIQYMVEIMAPYLNGNELTVCNDDYRIIGQTNKTIHLLEISGLNQPNSDGVLSPESVTFFKNDIIFNQVRNCTEPFIYESSIFICRAICMNVFHSGEYACRIIVPEDINTFRGYEAGLVRFFTGFIQLVYDLSIDGSDILPRNHMADIFNDLLNGKSIEAWRLENSISQHEWHLDGPFLCSRIMPSDRDYYTHTIPYYCQVFNRDLKGCCFFEYDNFIVCVTDLKYYNDSSESYISTYLETFRDGYFRIGYGNVFTNIIELKQHYLQAKIALQIGLKQRPSHWFHKFSDVALSYMETKLTEELDGRFLCAPEILALHEYDKINQSNYLHTLSVYLDNQMNAVKTAGDLFIHRATMVYRLERIKELTGIDFKDSDKILYLKISVRLLFKC